jgi:hypothetical protein
VPGERVLSLVQVIVRVEHREAELTHHRSLPSGLGVLP